MPLSIQLMMFKDYRIVSHISKCPSPVNFRLSQAFLEEEERVEVAGEPKEVLTGVLWDDEKATPYPLVPLFFCGTVPASRQGPRKEDKRSWLKCSSFSL